MHDQLPNDLYIVFSGDGQKGKLRDGDGTNLLTMKLVGLKEFDNQSTRSVFPTLIWRGDESRSRRYVCKVMEEICTLRLLNFVISIITAH